MSGRTASELLQSLGTAEKRSAVAAFLSLEKHGDDEAKTGNSESSKSAHGIDVLKDE
ncbi:hypothetical protein L0663_01530 [Dyadobacter sp. CY107]|uniref:hypothetical protein n=1 Tax=Dyadobacter fanqingshengii TaxID=2906443 RepID=UPI001F24CFC8|nr:hypothetical protein [Dyadobacter fanqingshengii]MCF2502045.1 hypothetical protein [Dyadobacter fanqingshengii]